MPIKNNFLEAATLEKYGIALGNAQTQPEICKQLAEVGYVAAIIEEGSSLLNETISAFNYNNTEDDETSTAHTQYINILKTLEKTFGTHRKKAKIIFLSDSDMLDKLAVSGALPTTQGKLIAAAKKFYLESNASEVIQAKMARLKLTKKELKEGQSLVDQTVSARRLYTNEVGESENATKQKDAAFDKMDKWMSEFFAVAKIALEDSPQLLESLGKSVKS